MEQPRWDVALLAELSQVMRDASICGLGQAAPNPVDCVVKYFPHELAEPRMNAVTRMNWPSWTRRWSASSWTGARSPAGPTRRSSRSPIAKASRSRAFATRKAWTRSATAAPAWSRSRANASGASLLPRRSRRHGGEQQQRARRRTRRRWCWSCCWPTCRRPLHAPQRSWISGPTSSASASRASRRARQVAARPVASGDRREPRCLHPVHALRARLPRGAGQRRDRPGLARRARRRSCSTWTTRWATPPASPAASACRPARPAR